MSDRPRALVLAPLRGEGKEILESVCDIVYEPWIEQQPVKLYNPEDLAAKLAEVGATVLVCESDNVNGPVMEQPLKVIGCTRGDPNNVDIEAATKAGIPVLRAPGRNADAVAEMTVALLFATNRFIVAGDRDVRAEQVYSGGKIPYQRYRAWQLAGRTAGIVGLGAVGRATKWRLEGLGMKVIATDPFASDANCSLDELLRRYDVFYMHVGINPDTVGMI